MGALDEYDMLEQQLEAPDKDAEKKESRSRKHSSKDKDRERKRSRSRKRNSSRERRKRSRSRSKEKSSRRERSKDTRRRSRSPRRRSKSRRRDRSPRRRERTPPRAPTPPEVREQRERERELLELDRDIRTIFAYNLPLKATEQDLFNFFATAGKIVDVKIIMDRNTRRSKGFAYIEYAQREDIVKAMGLTGQILMGQAVMVKSSEAEKNLAWEAAQAQAAAMNQLNQLQNAGQGPCKLQVSHLHPAIQEADVKQIFDPFGTIELISIQKEGTGRNSSSVAFVTYTLVSDATKAMQQLDNMEIAGQSITVKIAPMSAQETAQLAAAASRVDLDDEDEGGGMRMNSSARAALMNRLAGKGQAGASTAPAPAPVPAQLPPPPAQQGPQMSAPATALMLEQGVLGPASPRPTLCVLLKNMFDPEQETQPDWDREIAEDVKEECGKFGSVNHVYVDRNSKGFVYLKFATLEGAAAAQNSLHGRWFAGNQVVAEFQFQQPYVEYFRCQ